jgi:hypothetical protein
MDDGPALRAGPSPFRHGTIGGLTAHMGLPLLRDRQIGIASFSADLAGTFLAWYASSYIRDIELFVGRVAP